MNAAVLSASCTLTPFPPFPPDPVSSGAKIADYRAALVKASDSQTILLCDGGASYALAVKDPSGNLKARVKGIRHNGLYLQAFDEALKTYVGFHASPVR